MAEKIDVEFVAKARKCPGPRQRAAEQVEFDREVELAYSNDVTLSYLVTPAEAEGLTKRVQSAARFLKLSPRAGEPRPGPRKGTVILQWRFAPVAKRTPKPAE